MTNDKSSMTNSQFKPGDVVAACRPGKSVAQFKSFIVIGGGIVGLASALKLAARFPGCRVVVLEKESQVGQHQTVNNSGVLHAGLYYKPGSLKARLAVAGIQEMTAFCRDKGVAHAICGKLVVAVEEGIRIRAPSRADQCFPSYVGEPFPVHPGAELEITSFFQDQIDPNSVPPPKLRIWPVARRILTESRDRLAPLACRLKSRFASKKKTAGGH